MNAAATALVVAGIVLAVVLAARSGLDPLGAILFLLIVGLGALVVAIARRASRGGVAPERCPRCGGLVSAHAPYCKHCGRPLE
jgi:F0F1-type ATP synthase assembly protein I